MNASTSLAELRVAFASLAALYTCAPRESTLAAAVRCGDHLNAHAVRLDDRAGWPSKAASKPLTGFSHGAAGIALALLRLAALSGETRFRDHQALAAFRYERGLFSAEKGNWPDLRDAMNPEKGDGEGFVATWCHGAPGVGLSRVLAPGHPDDYETRDEISAAVRTTIARGLLGNHCLCHGDLGNLECLNSAALALNDPVVRAEVNRRTGIIVESIHRDGWLCGNQSGVESPGLMTGLAGIGYQLLRLADPARVPSVLALAPPFQRR